MHYGLVFDAIKGQVEGERCALLERLAGAICQAIFDQVPLVQAISIEIFKDNPPINGHYDAVGIALERKRV